ncbi:hypothetical protein SXCC_02263 [Gluconacetobacter sp. SXCC-1]|nr:hypothetical protein SXCC_02263 [Gluconacetobacter sp. SXCC-1]
MCAVQPEAASIYEKRDRRRARMTRRPRSPVIMKEFPGRASFTKPAGTPPLEKAAPGYPYSFCQRGRLPNVPVTPERF